MNTPNLTITVAWHDMNTGMPVEPSEHPELWADQQDVRINAQITFPTGHTETHTAGVTIEAGYDATRRLARSEIRKVTLHNPVTGAAVCDAFYTLGNRVDMGDVQNSGSWFMPYPPLEQMIRDLWREGLSL
jgi:hypothetical protein